MEFRVPDGHELKTFIVDAPAYPFILFGHACYVAAVLKGRERSRAGGADTRYWVHSLLLTILCTFASSTVVSTVFMRPVPYLAQPNHLLVVAVAWYLIVRVKPVYDAATNRSVFLVLRFVDSLYRIRSFFAALEVAQQVFPDQVVAFFVAGVVSGYANGIIQNLDSTLRGLGEPGVFARPNFNAERAFFCTLLVHYGRTQFHWHDNDTRLLVAAIFVVTDMTQESFDPKSPFHLSERLSELTTGVLRALNVINNN
eukprot:TRINITY_DN21689_c0_g1_i1.p1 TRINITY_DN21689_c0_g1~~TRINITY_DN21689_c0_g1_i1.p1  ORF type:complete len:255 (+),score=51.62 TRINITY_DN21689_c0_g1_i1:40-804(+)